jgi:hypothetical protein
MIAGERVHTLNTNRFATGDSISRARIAARWPTSRPRHGKQSASEDTGCRAPRSSSHGGACTGRSAGFLPLQGCDPCSPGEVPKLDLIGTIGDETAIGDPSRFVLREHLRLRRFGRVVARVDVRERLPAHWRPHAVAARDFVGIPWRKETALPFCHGACLSEDTLEHHGEGLTPVDRRVGRPFEDRANLILDGFPLGAFALQIEFC